MLSANKQSQKVQPKISKVKNQTDAKVDSKHGKEPIVSKTETNYDPLSKPKVGFEHRYRISNMNAKIDVKESKRSKKPSKNVQSSKSEIKKEPLKKESKLKSKLQDEFNEPELKPKVGFEYRYRISNLISEVGIEAAKKYKKPIIQPKKETNVEPKEDMDYDPSSKPKVGFEYRYRISKMAADKNYEQAKEQKVSPKSQPKKESFVDIEKDSKYDPSLKPKVGFEYRYSIK